MNANYKHLTFTHKAMYVHLNSGFHLQGFFVNEWLSLLYRIVNLPLPLNLIKLYLSIDQPYPCHMQISKSLQLTLVN